MSSTFLRELTLNEFATAQGILDLRARQNKRRFFMILLAVPILTIMKIAVIQISLVLLPIYLFTCYLHSFYCVRCWRTRKGSRLVLWLRRFHRKDLRQFPFGTILESACHKFACPITIQDSTYQVSWNSLIAKGVIKVILMFMLKLSITTILFLVLLIIPFKVMEFLKIPQDILMNIFGFLFLCSIPKILSITFKSIRLAGFTQLKTKNYERRISKLILNAKKGYATSALQIVKCDDDFWQKVVLQALKYADAVVVDVSEINSNVDWELTQIKSCIKPEKIVLCCAARNGKLVCNENSLIHNLESILGQDMFRKSYRLVYELPKELDGPLGFLEKKLRNNGFIAAFRYPQDNLNMQRVLCLAIHS
jgi:hypothetical protein